MTYEEVEAAFADNQDEFTKDERITERLAHRADVHAFVLLDKLFPPTDEQMTYGPPDMLCGAEHDKIHLSQNVQDLADAGITTEQVVDLIRCGVMVGDGNLTMFV